MSSELRELVFSLPIVDTHTHMRQYESFEQPVTAVEFFNSCGCLSQYWVSSGAISRQEYRARKRFDDWESLEEGLRQVRSTAYYRMLLAGLKRLYNLDFDELDRASFDRLDDLLREAYQDPDWYREVLRDRSGLAVIMQDTRLSPTDRTLFTPVARLDHYVWFARPDWRKKVTETHGEEATSTLAGVIDCLRKDFEAAMAAGAVAIKSNDTWGRRIDYEAVSEAAAEDALAVCNNGECDPQSARALGDYLMGRICDLCAEFEVPLQIHTGPAMGTDHFIDYGNPLNLNSLFMRHPETKFVVFHAGGPFVLECRALAIQFQNVYLDLCGVLGVESARWILDDWIEYVPHTKIMWGTDVNLVEEAFAISQGFRKVLSDFLEARIKSGYLSQAAAADAARAILAENAARVHRLDGLA